MGGFFAGKRWIGDHAPTYFIADISANHDGDLERARMLIHLAANSGANAAKFQNFRASRIVSERGFATLEGQLGHQRTWKKSVCKVYEDASLPWEWTQALKGECDKAGIDYFSTPYDLDAVDMLDPYVAIFKIGSGDITWPEMLHKVAAKNKPVILATGASELGDVQRALRAIRSHNTHLVLMQCNTNYTGALENFRHIHLNVLRSYRLLFPEAVLGLSDHTPGHTTVLGAVALGARVIEKHLTEDNARDGPDHPFSMTGATWREMVERTRELECALGCTEKCVAENESETIIVQRRCLRAAQDLPEGTLLERGMIEVLRPAPRDAIYPYDLERVLGLRLLGSIPRGDYLRWTMLAEARSSRTPYANSLFQQGLHNA